jgi:hypothetical protein
MKRVPLKRKTPLVRKKWMRTTRKSAYKRRPRDPAYMAWVRRQPCCARVFSHLCSGPIEADHAGRRSAGRKADDRTCIPLCRRHHRERTDFSGAFKTWNAQDMRYWLNLMIARHQAEYHMETKQGAPQMADEQWDANIFVIEATGKTNTHIRGFYGDCGETESVLSVMAMTCDDVEAAIKAGK